MIETVTSFFSTVLILQSEKSRRNYTGQWDTNTLSNFWELPGTYLSKQITYSSYGPLAGVSEHIMNACHEHLHSSCLLSQKRATNWATNSCKICNTQIAVWLNFAWKWPRKRALVCTKYNMLTKVKSNLQAGLGSRTCTGNYISLLIIFMEKCNT